MKAQDYLREWRWFASLFLFAIVFRNPLNASVFESSDWPKIIHSGNTEITVYQPEPETLEGAEIAVRCAVSVKSENERKPVFGAIWINATLVSDRENRRISFTHIHIPSVRFSDALQQDEIDCLTQVLEKELSDYPFEMSTDDLIATFEGTGETVADEFNNAPPAIWITEKPAILLYIDGEAITEELNGFQLKRVQNTPLALFYYAVTRKYYLFEEDHWFVSDASMSKFALMQDVRDDELIRIREVIRKSIAENSSDNEADLGYGNADFDIVPEVWVSKVPAELIEIDGSAVFKPITGTQLLYVANTSSNVLMDIPSQRYFVLLGGRWYSSTDLQGKWEFVAAANLPSDFARIPEGSQMDAVLASVPGTPASRDALLDNQIPQTAEVDRSTASMEVEYDGSPDFEKVEGTSMYYAVNSPQTVLMYKNEYYAVNDGVWFVAATSFGPWIVATARPDEVVHIRPGSPVYQVKYVYIYDVTPEYVFVGYTPGYYGSYVSGPTVVYGTGYHYHAWRGHRYCPRPVTYGFHMYYNPWTGWSFGRHFTYGTWVHPYHLEYAYHGWWGPVVYQYPYHRYDYHHHHGHDSHRREGYYGHRPASGSPSVRHQAAPGVYNCQRPGVKPSKRPEIVRSSPIRNENPTKPNNVYTDREGKVYQKTNRGWNERNENEWKDVNRKVSPRPETKNEPKREVKPVDKRPPVHDTKVSPRKEEPQKVRPVHEQRPPATFDKNRMEKQTENRDRGAVRHENFQKAKAPATKATPVKKETQKTTSRPKTETENKKTR